MCWINPGTDFCLDHNNTDEEKVSTEVPVKVEAEEFEPEKIEVNPVSDIWCEIRTGEKCPRFDVREVEPDPETLEEVIEIVWSTIWE